MSIEGLKLYFGSWKCRIFSHNNQWCKSIKTLESTCKRHKYTGAKIISLFSIETLTDLLKQGVKVIHLVRDPRSTWLSRAKITAGKDRNKPLEDYLQTVQNKTATDSRQFSNLCKDLEQDLALLEKVHKEMRSIRQKNNEPNRFENYKLVRYEDVALYPVTWAKAMYTFLDIPWHTDVHRWIKENTHTGQNQSSG